MNWDDPVARARLTERVGINEYNRLYTRHRADSVIETVNGHALRFLISKLDGLIRVGDSGATFPSIEEAREWAMMLTEKPDLALAARIRHARVRRGMSIDDLASALEVETAHAHAWEAGKALIYAADLAKLCRVLDISPNEVLLWKS